MEGDSPIVEEYIRNYIAAFYYCIYNIYIYIYVHVIIIIVMSV